MSDYASRRVRELQDYHERDLPEKSIEDYVWSFKQHPEADLDAAVAEWKRTNAPVGRFPSIADIERCASVVRERKLPAEKAAKISSRPSLRAATALSMLSPEVGFSEV